MPEKRRFPPFERAAWIVVVILLAIAWFVKSGESSETSDRLASLRQELQDTQQQVDAVADTIAVREERFPVMGAACASLINHYAQDVARLQEIAGDYYNGRTTEATADLEGWARGREFDDFFVREGRARCGLDWVDSWYDEVRLVREAWIEGVVPPE